VFSFEVELVAGMVENLFQQLMVPKQTYTVAAIRIWCLD
jgi:hypothetical protein